MLIKLILNQNNNYNKLNEQNFFINKYFKLNQVFLFKIY